jgi:hypothetical protein
VLSPSTCCSRSPVRPANALPLFLAVDENAQRISDSPCGPLLRPASPGLAIADGSHGEIAAETPAVEHRHLTSRA